MDEVKNMDLVRRDTIFDNNSYDWVEIAKEQMAFFADIRQYIVNLELMKQNYDNEIDDILDYIESTNFNVAQGYKVYKILRDKRKLRKEVVQELNQLEILTESLECEYISKVYQKAIAKMQQVESEKKRSIVIQQLFEREVS